MSQRPKKLVIGIDYGTTNSGVAYAIVNDLKNDNVDINVVREWSHGVREENLPSDIAYDEAGAAVGYAFDIPDGTEPLQWVKLLLEPEGLGKNRTGTERVWQSYEKLKELGKLPVDVIADYLRWLWGETEKSLKESGDDVEAEEVVVTITLPASWSDRARNSMLKAAQQAGIDADGRILKFRVEPEAAALFELKARTKKGQVKVGDCFIVCDAGGGTVDLVSFQVLSLEPLSLNQVVVSKGEFCGSAFINAEFESQLRFSLGSDYNRLSNDVKAQIRKKFEEVIKRRYNPEKPAEYTVPVPGLEDSVEKGIKDEKLRLNQAILKRSFEEIMTPIHMLINEQKDELEAKGLLQDLKAILLVGGFGGSEYLQARLRQAYPDHEGIKVWRGSHSWTAVVQGAVQCEIANREVYAPVNQRLSRYHYGIPYHRGDFSKVHWLIRKGQDVRDSSHIEPYILRLQDREWLDKREYATISVSLVKSDKDDVTEDDDSSLKRHVDIECKVPTSIRNSPEAKLLSQNPKVWQIPAELILEMDGPLLTVRCRIQGRDVGLLDLKYRDDIDFPSHGFTAKQTMVDPEHPSERGEKTDEIVVTDTERSSQPPRISEPTTLGDETAVVGSNRLSGVSRWSSWKTLRRTSGGSKDANDRPISNLGAISPEGSRQPSRQGSAETSPSPSRKPLAFWRRDSKSEQEKETTTSGKEGGSKENEGRKGRGGAERQEKPSTELWVPDVDSKTGRPILRNQITGECVDAPSRQASGLGFHGHHTD